MLATGLPFFHLKYAWGNNAGSLLHLHQQGSNRVSGSRESTTFPKKKASSQKLAPSCSCVPGLPWSLMIQKSRGGARAAEWKVVVDYIASHEEFVRVQPKKASCQGEAGRYSQAMESL